MNWKDYFSTSIGKKILVGATGLFLVTFLVVHCYVNAMIFWPDTVPGKHFTDAAAFMGGTAFIRIIEVGLFAAFAVHIIGGLMLWSQNSKRRQVGYAVKAGNKTSKWYSRSMGLLGTLILLFLIVHLSQFWVPNRYGQFFDPKWTEGSLYARMLTTFYEPWVVIVYLLGCFSLSWHLMHGVSSSMQTLGLATHRYKGFIKASGTAFAIIVPLIFASMPVYLHILSHMGNQ